MLEDEQHGVNEAVPGNNPIAVGFNGFCWGGRSVEELNIFTEFHNVSGVIGNCVDIGEDMVKVDGVAIEQVKPFRRGKLWNG